MKLVHLRVVFMENGWAQYVASVHVLFSAEEQMDTLCNQIMCVLLSRGEELGVLSIQLYACLTVRERRAERRAESVCVAFSGRERLGAHPVCMCVAFK